MQGRRNWGVGGGGEPGLGTCDPFMFPHYYFLFFSNSPVPTNSLFFYFFWGGGGGGQ